MHTFRFACIFLVLLVIGCTKGDIETNQEEPTEEELPKNVFDENITEYFTEVTPSYIKVSASIPVEDMPEVGDVIVCTITENTPYGYLGKVTSIESTSDGYVWNMEPAALTDAFETLHVNESIDGGKYVESVQNEDGSECEFEIVDSSVWDDINTITDDENESDDPETKVPGGGYAETTVRLPVSWGSKDGVSVEGSLYFSFRLDMAVDIKDWKLVYTNLKVTPRIGADIEMTAEYKTEGEMTIFHKDVSLGAIPLANGLVTLRPELNVDLVLGYNGEVKIEANIRNEFMNTGYYIKYADGNWQRGAPDGTVKTGNRCAATSLDLKGEIYTDAKIGLTVGLYSADMIGVSMAAIGRHSLKGDFSLDNESLYKEAPSVGFERTLSGELTFFTDFLGDAFDYEKKAPTGDLFLGITPVELFPQASLKAESKNKKVNVVSDWETDENLLSVEFGVALLDDNYQVLKYHKIGEIGNHGTKSSSGVKDNISFEIPEAGDYKVAPYVGLEGNRYLGETTDVIESRKLIKSISVEDSDDGTAKCMFEYNEDGILIKATHPLIGEMQYLYGDNMITVNAIGSQVYATIDENGYLLALTGNESITFKYVDGFLNNTSDLLDGVYNYSNGNLISHEFEIDYTSGKRTTEEKFTYLQNEYKLNLFLYDFDEYYTGYRSYLFHMFPGIASKQYVSQISSTSEFSNIDIDGDNLMDYGTDDMLVTYDYVFDSDGDAIEMEVLMELESHYVLRVDTDNPKHDYYTSKEGYTMKIEYY